MSGRILNPVSRGYAVGIGGVVGFLPMSQCLVRTAQRIGVLQPFMVSEVTRKMGMRGTLQPNLVVIDAMKLREVTHHDHRTGASADLISGSPDPTLALTCDRSLHAKRCLLRGMFHRSCFCCA